VGKKEVFSYAHSSLHDVIKRSCFRVLKMMWRILLDLPSHSMQSKAKIILACMDVHSFIRESAMKCQYISNSLLARRVIGRE
jgi:hypothetical protein